jgi:hypothetical protein
MRLTDVRWIAGLFGLVVLAACTANPRSADRPSESATGSAAPCRIPYTTFQLTGFMSYPDGTSGAKGDVGKTWVLTAPAAQRAIAAQGFTGTAIADERGLLLSGDGVYLYPVGGPIKKVSAQTGGWLLGTCG